MAKRDRKAVQGKPAAGQRMTVTPNLGGQRKAVVSLPAQDGMQPIWSYVLLDIGGRWCWGSMDARTLVSVLTKLKSFERMNWQELRNDGSHSVPTFNLIKDARDRLEQLHLDDYDEIYSLRLTGTQRIYGIKDGGVIRILWWDPIHEIYHVEKKGT